MSVVSVRARSFILALFIRDDGERFLLGDNGYDFVDSQLHFSANTIENDEVEKQGADGTMLAGQVRRASVQTFDGYVGDATTPKDKVEEMRRDFIAFFAKDHHFRVIYVDCNRTAWQRKGGYLVDAPEVKELWQIHPEYHVGLNFEDVNYYEYDENAEGEEILSNIISVPISSDVEGGLVWDENGAVSEPAEIEYDTETATTSGTNISISDAAAAPLSGFKLKGETSQNGTPTPDAPVEVQTVTGENVVKICGKNLFNKNAITSGKYISNTGTLVDAASFAYSDYIPVIGGENYSYSGSTQTVASDPPKGAWYDKDKNWISKQDYAQSGTITAPANAAYYRTSIRITASSTAQPYADTYQLEKGSQATTYEPYQEQSYPISLGSIELCKIGDYQDYIYKSDGKWYVHKEVDRKNLNGSEGWALAERSGSNNGVFYIDYNKIGTVGAKNNGAFSNYARFISGFSYKVGQFDTHYSQWRFYAPNNTITLNEWKTNLGATPLVLYYLPATPTDTEITNEALVAQLEAILSQGKTYAGTNNITTVISAGNEQGELEIGYYTRYEFEITAGGYVWEQGGSGGPTVVTNESISAVSPVWTVFGPALNPQLENVTTGEQIQYVGMIGEGQTLVVDMGQQTALLDGLNVVANIVGDYLSLAPGSNTLLFSADSDAPESEIGWSEIVG